MMKRSVYGLLLALGLIGINASAIPLALFSMFDMQAGTNIFSIDYSIVFAIFFIPNIVSIGLFVTAKKEAMMEFFICLGLAIAVTVVIGIAIFTLKYFIIAALVVGISVVVSIVLMAKALEGSTNNHTMHRKMSY